MHDWTCPHCTLTNPGKQGACRNCRQPRGSTPDAGEPEELPTRDEAELAHLQAEGERLAQVDAQAAIEAAYG